MIDDGSLVMLGVIQEQHADRCRLFQQWQQLDFPVVQDCLNTNGIAVVPVYVAIDQFGIVRGRYRRFTDFQSKFLKKEFSAPTEKAPIVNLETASINFWKQKLKWDESVTNAYRTGDAEVLWGGNTSEAVDSAIAYYKIAVEKLEKGTPQPVPSDLYFRLGAAYRIKYELDGQRDAKLFADCVAFWEKALKLNPNQYIYRRRIEQYGPRLKKPYSFYDWVSKAREEIQKRGETPVQLAVEPNGAELALRARKMEVQTGVENPDPKQQIELDQNWVKVHVNTVPSRPKPGSVAAVHLGFHLSENANWNHESTPLQVWLDSPEGEVSISAQLIEDKTPHPKATSSDPISIALEVKTPKEGGAVKLKGFALYHICEEDGGQCVYRRKNFELVLE